MDEQDEFDFDARDDEDANEFGGETYEADLDHERLSAQVVRVRDLMKDSQWRTLFEIQEATGDATQSASARLRDLRKDKFGGHTVDRRRRGPGKRGLFEYQLIFHERMTYERQESAIDSIGNAEEEAERADYAGQFDDDLREGLEL